MRVTPVPVTPYGMSNTNGATRLRAWMKKNGDMKQKAFAERLGTTQASVSLWLLGRPPNLKFALRIRDLTGIPVEDWDHTYVSGESARARRHAGRAA